MNHPMMYHLSLSLFIKSFSEGSQVPLYSQYMEFLLLEPVMSEQSISVLASEVDDSVNTQFLEVIASSVLVLGEAPLVEVSKSSDHIYAAIEFG